MRFNFKRLLSVILSVACIAGNTNGVLANPGVAVESISEVVQLKTPPEFKKEMQFSVYGVERIGISNGKIIVIKGTKSEYQDYLKAVNGVSLVFGEDGTETYEAAFTSDGLSKAKAGEYVYTKKEEASQTLLGISNLEAASEDGMIKIVS